MENSQGREKILKVCDAISIWGIFLLFFALPFEEEDRTIYYGVQIMAIGGWFARIIFESTLRQWKKTAWQYMGAILLSVIVVLLFGRRPFTEVYLTFLWEVGILTFFLLFILNRENPFRPSVSKWKLKKIFDYSLALYGLAVYLSAFLSYFPDDSFPQLRKGFVTYLLIYLCISNNIRKFGKFKKVILAGFISVAIISVVVFIQGLMFPLGNYDVKGWLVRREAVRLFNPYSTNPLFHVQFPFDHFYKTGLILAVGLQLVMVQYFITIRRVSRRWVTGIALIAYTAIIFTLSRSAFNAALVSMILLISITKKKYFITLAVILLLTFLIVPGIVKDFYMDMFEPANYNDPDSRMSFRLERWTLVGEMIARNPIVGTGYGWKQFPEAARYVRPGAGFERDAHPYSWYLQRAQESGLLGLGAFLSFSVTLFALLFIRWKDQPAISYYRGINAALISMLAVPYIFGFVSYVYLGAPELLVWIIYGLCTAYLKLTVKPFDIEERRRELERQRPDTEWA